VGMRPIGILFAGGEIILPEMVGEWWIQLVNPK